MRRLLFAVCIIAMGVAQALAQTPTRLHRATLQVPASDAPPPARLTRSLPVETPPPTPEVTDPVPPAPEAKDLVVPRVAVVAPPEDDANAELAKENKKLRDQVEDLSEQVAKLKSLKASPPGPLPSQQSNPVTSGSLFPPAPYGSPPAYVPPVPLSSYGGFTYANPATTYTVPSGFYDMSPQPTTTYYRSPYQTQAYAAGGSCATGSCSTGSVGFQRFRLFGR